MLRASRYPALPVKGNLAPASVASLAAGMAVAVGSVVSLTVPAIAYPTKDLMRSFLPNDVVNLAVGLPALLVSMWLARRGALLGLLFWPGALFYLLYNYLVPTLSLPPNGAFFLDLSAAGLSLYATVRLVTGIDRAAVREQKPERRSFIEAIESADLARMSIASFVATSIVIESRYGAEGLRDLDRFISRADIELVPVDQEQGQVARSAFSRFGKGRHRAGLNYGDCFSYAAAMSFGEPLLCKGDDFIHTDVPIFKIRNS